MCSTVHEHADSGWCASNASLMCSTVLVHQENNAASSKPCNHHLLTQNCTLQAAHGYPTGLESKVHVAEAQNSTNQQPGCHSTDCQG